MNQELRIKNKKSRKNPNSLFITCLPVGKVHNSHKSSAFTLIEVLITLAILAFLTSMTIFIINPADRLADARNDERKLNVNLMLLAIGQNIANNTGTFNCSVGDIPTTTATVIGTSTYDIHDCLVTEYLSELPVDPVTGFFASSTDYNTGYSIIKNATTTQITISAPDAELGEIISVTR